MNSARREQGTDLSPENQARSDAYAAQNGLPKAGAPTTGALAWRGRGSAAPGARQPGLRPRAGASVRAQYRYVLHPKVVGWSRSVALLRDTVSSVYDVTIGARPPPRLHGQRAATRSRPPAAERSARRRSIPRLYRRRAPDRGLASGGTVASPPHSRAAAARPAAPGVTFGVFDLLCRISLFSYVDKNCLHPTDCLISWSGCGVRRARALSGGDAGHRYPREVHLHVQRHKAPPPAPARCC